MRLRSLVLGIFFLLVSPYLRAQAGTVTARQAYLFGFSSVQTPNINQRCVLYDSIKLKFCREGFHASKVFSEPLLDYIAKPLTYGSAIFYQREAALGYGIGVGENLEKIDLMAKTLRQFYFLKGLRYYFVDGLGMGVFSPGVVAQKKATSQCRSLPLSTDKALCFFGLGRASVFAKSEWFKEKEYALSYSELYHVLQGYMYARIYANDDASNSLPHDEPGVLAAMQSMRIPISELESQYKLQQACARQVDAHHYLCALRVLNPFMLFIAH
ncbi:MAG: hypothetical protein HUU57_04645 [Bdellovibrio sp.]|nr:hypothetical protein [Bdellovibrio sp.]